MAKIVIAPLEFEVGQKVRMNGFGDEMDEAFREVYSHVISAGEFRLTEAFEQASTRLFEKIEPGQKVEVSDAYFNNFTPLTESLRARKQQHFAADVWRQVISLVRKWEDSNAPKTLHKGTPYYFWGAMALESLDVDTALMAMHNALREDKANQKDWRGKPAHYFFSINDSQDLQYFKPFVDGMAGFVKRRLDEYHGSRGGKLDYPSLRSRFLDAASPDIEDLRHFFVYGVIRLWRLRILEKAGVGDSRMAPMIFLNALMALLLVLDTLADRLTGADMMSGHTYELASRMGWAKPPTQKEAYIEDLEVNQRRDKDFRVWLAELLDGKYRTKSGRVLDPLEADFALSWGIRNFAAHTVTSQEILWENFIRVLQAIFNSLFITVELL